MYTEASRKLNMFAKTWCLEKNVQLTYSMKCVISACSNYWLNVMPNADYKHSLESVLLKYISY